MTVSIMNKKIELTVDISKLNKICAIQITSDNR